MTEPMADLADLGWNTFFQSQLEPGTDTAAVPARVMAVHRGALVVAGVGFDERSILPFSADAADATAQATVGDWLLLDRASGEAVRLLARKSLFKRLAAGTEHKVQLIAANIDVLFIVTSCNQDFNPARLERYLALAADAGVTPVIVLTKADLTETPEDYVRTAARLQAGLMVETVDARDPGAVGALAAWCAHGQTVALVGSSGVGKSTLVATLSGAEIATKGIREGDAKGRHTTTARMLYRLPGGGWLLDTPGMRELQLGDARAGIDELFAEIADVAARCKFGDCAHDGEPGCAVAAALADGTLAAAQVARWRKLADEDAHNSATMAQRRAHDRTFGKQVRAAVRGKKQRRE